VGTDEVSHKERSHAAQASSNQHALRDHLRHRPGQHNAQDQKADRDGRKVYDQRMGECIVPERSPLADETEAQAACHHEAVPRTPQLGHE
jgi:hypothetical protein